MLSDNDGRKDVSEKLLSDEVSTIVHTPRKSHCYLGHESQVASYLRSPVDARSKTAGIRQVANA